MGSARRSLPARMLLALEVVLAALVPAGAATAAGSVQVTVMTQNLYDGTAVTAYEATSWPELVAAGGEDWAGLLGSDFPTRARALADQIVRVRPDVVGLQEVTLWRDQTPGNTLTHPAPDAQHVVFDFLAILQRALRARGLPYTAVATSAGVDVEFPRQGPGGRLVDLRLSDRDAIIVRSDVAAQVSNPRHGHYTAQHTDPFLTGPVPSTRGWTSIDYRPAPGTTVRIFNTHLEVADPGTGTGTVQEDQGNELLRRIAASPYPVIALGDFNAPADTTISPTYRNLTAVLHDAWTSARPADPGQTCCHPSLARPSGREHTRIDLLLTSGHWPVSRVARIGERPFRAAPPPVWPSDHLGVTARIGIPRR